MSVFTLDVRKDNPVTIAEVDSLCDQLGVKLPENEKESYKTLLGVYHESMEALMALEGK
jgi:amidase